jgi:hypothetical protein
LHLDKSKSNLLIGVAFLSLLTIFCAACGSIGGSSTASGGTTNATPTATCPPNRSKTATGTLQSVTGTSLLVHSTQGSSVQASYATTTRIQREATVATSALKEGTFVTVAVKQDTSGNYTATRIMLVANRAGGFGGGTGGTGTGRFGGGTGGTGGRFGGGTGGTGTGRTRNANCLRAGGANGGAFGGGAGTTTSANTLTGTTGQLSGTTLTITDLQGSNYTVTLDAATQIVQYQSATASALKSGASITLTGSADSQGVITAQSITILLPTSSTAGSAA